MQEQTRIQVKNDYVLNVRSCVGKKSPFFFLAQEAET